MTDEIRGDLRIAYDRNVAEREGRSPWKKQIAERDAFLGRMRASNLNALLDVGAATGIDGRFFADNGVDVTCIDLSAANVKAACDKNLHAIEMDCTAMTFADCSFDAVWSWDCLLHLPLTEWPQALAEIQRVLRPNGLFFLGVYGGLSFEGVWEDDSYRPKRFYAFMEDELFQTVLSRYFEPIDFRTHRISPAAPAHHFQAFTGRKSVG